MALLSKKAREYLIVALANQVISKEVADAIDAAPDSNYTGQAGKGIKVNSTEDGFEFYDATDSDEKTKISANDTSSGYLEDKVTVSSGSNSAEILEISTLNDGADEDVQIQIDETKIDHDNLKNFASNEHFTMLDEDDMASNSDTQAATQQSIRQYVNGVNKTVIVTVGAGFDYTDIHAAIDYVASKKGGTIIIAQDFLQLNNTQNKDVSNITFKSRNPNTGAGSFIQFNGGSGVWSGTNVRFENFMFATRHTYLGAAPFKATNNSFWSFKDCFFGSSGLPTTAKPLFNADSYEVSISFYNTQQVQTTKPFSTNDSNMTLSLYNRSSALVTSIATLYRDSSSTLHGGTVASDNLVDKFIKMGDTPASYSGQAGKPLLVNAAENALEFVALGGTWGSKPTTGLIDGRCYFDTGLKKPFWYNSGDTSWYDATGTIHP